MLNTETTTEFGEEGGIHENEDAFLLSQTLFSFSVKTYKYCPIYSNNIKKV